MRSSRARRAFTIVELAVVLAILGLIAGLAVPRYSAAAARYRLKSAAYRMVSDLDMARAAARASSTSVTVNVVTGSSGQLQVTNLPAAVGPSPYTVSLAADPYRVTVDSANFSGSTSFIFNGHGVGADGTIVVSTRGIRASIVVSKEPGLTAVQFTGS